MDDYTKWKLDNTICSPCKQWFQYKGNLYSDFQLFNIYCLELNEK